MLPRPGPAFPLRLAAVVVIALLLWLLVAVTTGDTTGHAIQPPTPTTQPAPGAPTTSGYVPVPAGPPTDQP
jgi:hypothetical protein